MHSCCWQRQADPLTKDIQHERHRTWRPARPPRSSSHKVHVCLSLVLLMTYCLNFEESGQALKRYWNSHNSTHPTCTHVPGLLFPFLLSVEHTAGKKPQKMSIEMCLKIGLRTKLLPKQHDAALPFCSFMLQWKKL